MNKHQVEILDVTVCGSKTANNNTADSEQLQQDIKKEAMKLVFRVCQEQKKTATVSKLLRKKKIAMQNLLVSRFRN